MAQTTIHEVELTTQVARLMLEGHSLTDVVEYLRKDHPDLNAQQATEWAFEWFEQSAEIPEKARRGWCLEAYRELYRKMVEVADFSGAAKCVQEIAKLTKPAPRALKPEGWTQQLKSLSASTPKSSAIS